MLSRTGEAPPLCEAQPCCAFGMGLWCLPVCADVDVFAVWEPAVVFFWCDSRADRRGVSGETWIPKSGTCLVLRH